MIPFDNTADTKERAKHINLELPKGKQNFIFKKGEKVSSSPLSPITITGKVIDRYKQNGYAYYIVRAKGMIPIAMREMDLKK